MRWNHISGIEPRTDPFMARINAALLVDFLGLKGPFSVAFSDGNSNYNLPAYAFYGFSPTYKWIKLHLGDRSMNFSPYSLSGHNFKGVGLELNPGKFYVGLMAGRLLRARIAEAGAIQNLDPVYKRTGKGLKLGFKNESDELNAILFHAADQTESTFISDSARIRPQENLVLEVQGKKSLGQLFDFSFDLAHSAITRDKSAPLIQNPKAGFNGNILGLFKPHSSTAYGQAWNFELGFRPTFANFTLSIEHIGAGYQSLGRLAFLNDTENIQLGASTNLLKKKITLSTAIGIQKNGLAATNETNGARFIGSANVTFAISQRFNTSIALSNMNYTIRQRVTTAPFVVLDSIVIVQSNISTQIAASYLLGSKMQSVLSFSLSYQNANAINNDQIDVQNENSFYAGMLSYTWNLEEKNWTVTTTCMANLTSVGIGNTNIISPSISAQKKLLNDKLNLDFGISYSRVQTPNNQTSGVWENRLGGQWKITKKQGIQCQLAYVSNTFSSELISATPFTDFNAQLGYMLTF